MRGFEIEIEGAYGCVSGLVCCSNCDSDNTTSLFVIRKWPISQLGVLGLVNANQAVHENNYLGIVGKQGLLAEQHSSWWSALGPGYSS